MLKAATICRFTCQGLDASMLEESLQKGEFIECGVTQQKSTGFIPPRGEHGALVEAIDGHYLCKVQTEVRKVPSQALARQVDALADQVEKTTGRKPGKKLLKELKEQAMLDLLPQAFTSRSAMLIWFDTKAGLLVIDTASSSKADEIVTHLVRLVDGIGITLKQTAMSPAVAMAHWLGTGEAPYAFTIDRECELKSCDEMKSVVRYGRHNLDTDEVRAHIVAGKMPTRVAMTWRDRVSFVLDESGRLKKIGFLDLVFEGANAEQPGDAFDADAAIATGELSGLLPDLFEALGGLQVIGEQP